MTTPALVTMAAAGAALTGLGVLFMFVSLGVTVVRVTGRVLAQIGTILLLAVPMILIETALYHALGG